MQRLNHVTLVLVLLLLAACGQPAATATATIQPAVETPTVEPSSDLYREARLSMVELTIAGRGVENPDVLAAMETVPRHLFVPNQFLADAYKDHPLPIGFGQTISQPYIVALMTEFLELQPGEKVLEIGTGSGYQAAVLAELGYVDVYSVEIIPELSEQATDNLERAGYDEVHLRQGDGYFGWEEHAPYDAIIVTAAPDHLPQPLVQQLSEDGRLVIPIGPVGGFQTLWQFEFVDGELVAHNLGDVLFVPLVGGESD